MESPVEGIWLSLEYQGSLLGTQSLSWVLSQRRKRRKGFPRGEASSAKAQSCDFSTDGRGLREGSRMVRVAKSERDCYNLLLF